MKPAEVYILERHEPYRSIIMHVQMLVESTIPSAELLFKWKMPFYYAEQRAICYINQTKNYVDVVFWNAARFTKFQELLVTDNRKRMKSLRYKTIEDIDEVVLIELLKQAYLFREFKFLT